LTSTFEKAGWGIFNGTHTSDELLFADIDSVSDETCFGEPKGNYLLKGLSSVRTFCAGNPGQSQGPCNGDSGQLIQ